MLDNVELVQTLEDTKTKAVEVQYGLELQSLTLKLPQLVGVGENGKYFFLGDNQIERHQVSCCCSKPNKRSPLTSFFIC